MEDLNTPFEEKKKTVFQIIQEDHEKLIRIEDKVDNLVKSNKKMQDQMNLWKTILWVLTGIAGLVGWGISQLVNWYKG